MLKTILLAENGLDKLIKIMHDRNQLDLVRYKKQVREIVETVQAKGDKALLAYTHKFDKIKFKIEQLPVSQLEITEALQFVDQKYLEALKEAADNIKKFHSKQKINSWQQGDRPGVIVGQKHLALEKVGIYVPGGRAAYPSSVLMTALPAKVAGVEEIIMVTPPGLDGKIDPTILAAAHLAGVDRIFKIGGAQAVAALAYGTNTIAKVDKIVGPGNIYVSLAKQMVFGQVDIDMIAGPSEILVIADQNADPKYVAADLLSQAEHDPLAASVLITPSVKLAKAVELQIEKQISTLSRKDIIEESLTKQGLIIISQDLKEAVSTANLIAPEHLVLTVAEPFNWLSEIKHAGSIFLGAYSPEPLGDYLAGPNHVLPTNGSARYFSPLGLQDFMKTSSFIYYNKAALAKVKDQVVTLAEREGLTAHANAIAVRFADQAGEQND